MAAVEPRARDFGRIAYGAGRASAQRLTIARTADAARGRAFSVEELATSARAQDPGIGLATVYRAVAAMEAAGFIEQLGTRDGAVLYARCPSTSHHHHMLCTACNAVADVACPVPEQPSGGGADGFRVTGHRLVLYGLCGACGADADALVPTRESPRSESDCCGSAGDA